MKKSSTKKPARKARCEFPLTRHSRGVWCKNIKTPDGWKMFYFGRIQDDPDGVKALELFNHEAPFHREGRIPPPLLGTDDENVLTTKRLCNEYLNFKNQQVESGELKPRSLRELRLAAERLVDAIGKARRADDLGPQDFERVRAEISRHCGPVRTKNEITRIKGIFRWAYKQGLLDSLPRYGAAFDPPSAKTIRLAKAAKGARLFTPAEIRTLLDLANVRQKAHILVALNCGFGQSDLSELTFQAIDLQAGWVDFARVKTGAPRRCWLWPETCRAIQAAIDARVEPADPSFAERVFLTRYGLPLVRDVFKGCAEDTVAIRFRALLKRAGMADSGLSFYRLRHTHRHITDMAQDQPAANFIMGNIDQTMPANYRGLVEDDRLKRVSEYVRAWLYGAAADDTTEEPAILRFPSAG